MKTIGNVVVPVLMLVGLAGCSDDGASDAESPTADIAQEDVDAASGADAGVILTLASGNSVQLPAAGDSGQVSVETPVEVAFESVECAATLPSAGFDENYQTTDFVAVDGDQACLVELAVTNVGTKPNSFGSQSNSTLRTADGVEFSVTSQSYDDQGIARRKEREPSFTSDMIQPGKTKYDYVIYEIPADAKPETLVYNVVTYEG